MHFFFAEDSPLQSTAVINGSSCVIIKPHVLEEKHCGALIQRFLDAKLSISAMQMFYLDRATCDEFFEVYKVGIVFRMFSPSLMPLVRTPAKDLSLFLKSRNFFIDVF